MTAASAAIVVRRSARRAQFRSRFRSCEGFWIANDAFKLNSAKQKKRGCTCILSVHRQSPSSFADGFLLSEKNTAIAVFSANSANESPDLTENGGFANPPNPQNGFVDSQRGCTCILSLVADSYFHWISRFSRHHSQSEIVPPGMKSRSFEPAMIFTLEPVMMIFFAMTLP